MKYLSQRLWLAPALAGLIFWGIWGFLPKIALQTLPPPSVLFYEAIGNMLVVVPILIFLKFRLERNATGIQLAFVSGVINVGGILAFFYALEKGPVSIIVTLTALYPVVTLLLAKLVLKENISRKQGLAILMAFGSIILLTC